MEENNSLAGRALREELDKTREEQERRHQVMGVNCAESHQVQQNLQVSHTSV